MKYDKNTDPKKAREALNELSDSGKLFLDMEVRDIAWLGVGRLSDAEGILMQMLVDQESLAPGIRNECLIQKAKAYFGLKDS